MHSQDHTTSQIEEIHFQQQLQVSSFLDFAPAVLITVRISCCSGQATCWEWEAYTLAFWGGCMCIHALAWHVDAHIVFFCPLHTTSFFLHRHILCARFISKFLSILVGYGAFVAKMLHILLTLHHILNPTWHCKLHIIAALGLYIYPLAITLSIPMYEGTVWRCKPCQCVNPDVYHGLPKIVMFVSIIWF